MYGKFTVLMGKPGDKLVDGIPTSSHIKHGAHQITDHMMKKAVRCNVVNQMGVRQFPMGPVHPAQGRFSFPR